MICLLSLSRRAAMDETIDFATGDGRNCHLQGQPMLAVSQRERERATNLQLRNIRLLPPPPPLLPPLRTHRHSIVRLLFWSCFP